MKSGRSTYRPDDIDVQLLRALQADCKTSLARLGESVGLSAPSVMERIRKLEQAGILKGYHALVDSRLVGLDVTAFVGVSLNYPHDSDLFVRAVEDMPGVLECHHVTGAWTFALKVRARNTAGLEALIGHLRMLDGVTRTETIVVLSTRIERVQEPLEALGRPAPRRTRRPAPRDAAPAER